MPDPLPPSLYGPVTGDADLPSPAMRPEYNEKLIERLSAMQEESDMVAPQAQAVLQAGRAEQTAREYSALSEKVRKMQGTFDDIKRLRKLEAELRSGAAGLPR